MFGVIFQFWPMTPELSPAGRSTYDVFGNAAFAAANVVYGEFMTGLRFAPHATNGGAGSPVGPPRVVIVVVVAAHCRSSELVLWFARVKFPAQVTCEELPPGRARFSTAAPDVTTESVPRINNAARAVMIETRRTHEEIRTTSPPSTDATGPIL